MKGCVWQLTLVAMCLCVEPNVQSADADWWTALGIPREHIPYFFYNNPDVKAACEQDSNCPYKVGESRLRKKMHIFLPFLVMGCILSSSSTTTQDLSNMFGGEGYKGLAIRRAALRIAPTDTVIRRAAVMNQLISMLYFCVDQSACIPCLAG